MEIMLTNKQIEYLTTEAKKKGITPRDVLVAIIKEEQTKQEQTKQGVDKV